MSIHPCYPGRIRAGLLAVLLAAVAAVAGAAGLETVVVPSGREVVAGDTIELAVHVLNLGGESAPVSFPARLRCRLSWTHGTVEVEAAGAPLDDRVEPGAFRTVRYALGVPLDIAGSMQIDVVDLGVAPLVLTVRAPEAEQDAVEEHETLDSLFTLYQPYLGNIGAYKPMYFLVGANPEDSKLQISFSYRFFNPEGSLAGRHSWVQGFHFGYTQTSFWDLASDSLPFDDTSYKPELFFLSSNIGWRPSWSQGLFLRTGFEHESNGRAGDESRSTNYLYVKPMLILYSERTRLGLMIAPKLWAYAKNSNDNPDLADYRGYFDLEVKLGKADSLVVGSHLRWASEGASFELDLTYPLHRKVLPNVAVYLHAQYVSALAESLIDYKERTEAFRLGFAIVR